MSFLKTLSKGANFVFGKAGGTGYGWNDPWGGWQNFLPGAQADYRREAGILWDNSAVLACIKWAGRVFPEADIQIEKRGGDGEWQPQPNHPLLPVLENPNPHYDDSVLWNGALLSDIVDGNTYFYLKYNRIGVPVEMYYVPHFQVSPRWNPDGDSYIDYFEYRPPGQGLFQELDPANVLVIRNGVDPLNTRRGLSPMGAALREICTDNEASGAAAAMLKNRGVPGIIISPKEPADMAEDQRSKLQKLGQEKFTGDRRGEPWVTTLPIDVKEMGFNPAEMAFDATRMMPESRVTALTGIPAIILGFASGLARSTFANFEEAREAAAEAFQIPTYRRFAKQMTHHFRAVGVLAQDERVNFDVTQIRALQEDEDALHERMVKASGGPVLTPNEARAKIKRPPIEGGDDLRKARDPNDNEPDGDEPPATGKGIPKRPRK